jgi:type IV/VI secretion system ImpK/VasF family protein
MARLLHHFTPLFSYGLALDEKVSVNQASEPAAAVIARARELIDRAKAASLADGKRPEQVDGAAFAVVAWIDEIMARNPTWLVSGATPLQVTMFNTNNAGNEFFQHLSARSRTRTKCARCTNHAMLCGFVGQYYYENGDTGELATEGTARAPAADRAGADPYPARGEDHPQPYAVPDPSGPSIRWDACCCASVHWWRC